MDRNLKAKNCGKLFLIISVYKVNKKFIPIKDAKRFKKYLRQKHSLNIRHSTTSISVKSQVHILIDKFTFHCLEKICYVIKCCQPYANYFFNNKTFYKSGKELKVNFIRD